MSKHVAQINENLPQWRHTFNTDSLSLNALVKFFRNFKKIFIYVSTKHLLTRFIFPKILEPAI